MKEQFLNEKGLGKVTEWESDLRTINSLGFSYRLTVLVQMQCSEVEALGFRAQFHWAFKGFCSQKT